MFCSICKKSVHDTDSFYMFSDMLKASASKTAIVVCEDCSVTTTINDLFYKSLITMANCPDDVLEVDAVEISEPEYASVKTQYGVIPHIDKNAPTFNIVFYKPDGESEYVYRDEIINEIQAIYQKTKEVWRETHDRGIALEWYNALVSNIVKKYGFTPSVYCLPDPAYIRSDGTVGEVDSALLAGGGATQEDAEIYDDVNYMSEEDFLSKYANNPAALEEWQNAHV